MLASEHIKPHSNQGDYGAGTQKYKSTIKGQNFQALLQSKALNSMPWYEKGTVLPDWKRKLSKEEWKS